MRTPPRAFAEPDALGNPGRLSRFGLKHDGCSSPAALLDVDTRAPRVLSRILPGEHQAMTSSDLESLASVLGESASRGTSGPVPSCPGRPGLHTCCPDPHKPCPERDEPCPGRHKPCPDPHKPCPGRHRPCPNRCHCGQERAARRPERSGQPGRVVRVDAQWRRCRRGIPAYIGGSSAVAASADLRALRFIRVQ